jgi:PAS domain S-box-containing protein
MEHSELQLRRWFLVIFSLSCLLLNAIAYLLYEKNKEIIASKDLVTHTYTVIARLTELFSHVQDMETAQRDFLLTGREQFLDPYHAAGHTVRMQYNLLRGLTRDEPARQEELTQFNLLLSQIGALLESQIERRRVSSFSISIEDLEISKALMDRIRALNAGMLASENILLNRRLQMVNREQQDYNQTFFLSAGFSVVGLLAASLMIVILSVRRREAEKRFRASEERFRLAIEGINDGLFDYNLADGTLYFAPRLKEMLGYRDDEMENSFEALQDHIHPEDREAALAQLNRYFTHRIPTYVNIFRMRHRNGSWRWIMSRGAGLWNEQGKIVRLVGAFTDLTEQKELEQSLRDAREKAEAANIAKSEFLANISHELRTPMNSVVGLANILAMSKPLTDQQKEFVRTLQMSADVLLTIINDLLDLSKIEANSIELEKLPFNMVQLLQDIISLLSVRIREKGLNFLLDQESMKRRIYIGDPNRIRQVMLNLCSNAVKFTEKGHIRLSIRSEPSPMPGIEMVCINVADTGIGIPADKLCSVFDKFVQADSSITRKYGGTGLGLTITKSLVEAMNGSVTVESTPGEGSVFTVSIPLAVAPEDALPVAAMPKRAQASALT